MILGRSAGLWLGLAQTAVNLVALGYVAFSGSQLTIEQTAFFAGVNALAAAAIALLANQAATGTYLGTGK